MPNIPTDQGQLQPFSPTNEGAEAFASAGRRISGVYHEAGEQVGQAVVGAGKVANIEANAYDQEQGRQEVTKQIAATAQANMGLEQGYNAFLKENPNDPNAGEKFYQTQVLPTFQKMAENAQTPAGRQYAQRQMEDYGRYWSQKTVADAATLAGHQAINNFGIAGNSIAAGAIAGGADEHAIDFGLSRYDDLAANMEGTANLKAGALDEEKQKLKSQLVVGAIQSWAQKPGGAATATALLNNPKYSQFLDATQRPQIESYITHQAKSLETQARLDSKQAASDYIMNNVVNPDGSTRLLNAQDIGNLKRIPGIQPADLKAAESNAVAVFRTQENERQGLLLGKGVLNDQATVGNFIKKRAIGTLTIDDINEALHNNQLSSQHGMEFANELSPSKSPLIQQASQNPILKGEIARANAAIQGTALNSGEPVVKAQQEQFNADTLRIIQQAVTKAGSVDAAAPFYDPNSPNYLFSDKRIQQYIPTKAQVHSGAVIAPEVKQPATELSDREKQNKLQMIYNRVHGPGPAMSVEEQQKAYGSGELE